VPLNLLTLPKINYLIAHLEGDDVVGELSQVAMNRGILQLMLVIE
jgi:hypothetical protein